MEHDMFANDVSIDIPSHTMKLLKAHALINEENKKETELSWSSSQEDLLYTWVEKAAGYRWLHMRCYEYYTFLNNIYTYPIIILSSLAGFGGILINKQQNSYTENITIYMLFSMNFLVAVLSSLQKLHKYAEEAEKHSNQAVQYAKFYREINMELSLDRKERENGVIFIKNCKYKYDNLLNSGNSIHLSVIKQFNRLFPHIVNRPDITNGLYDLCCKRPKKSVELFRMDSIQANLKR